MSDLFWSLVIAVVAAELLLGLAGFCGALLAVIRPDHRNPFVRWFTDWFERTHEF